jgi:two-component system, NarL family, nitrate/nitrite response regulator NarL
LVRVVIAAQTRVYREGLAEILAQDDQLDVVGASADAMGCVEQATRLGPDIVLLDMSMPESIHAARSICSSVAGANVVALAVPEVIEEIVACAEAGVAGYVTREASGDELVHAVNSVARGDTILSPRLAAELLRHAVSATSSRNNESARRLTVRELEIIELIDEGLSNKQIATRLCIELTTVKNHVHHILEKLQVNRRAEAAAIVRDRRRVPDWRVDEVQLRSLR